MALRSNPSFEVALLRSLVAGLTFEFKLLKLRLALQRAYSPEQPRVPAGQPNAGQWAREAENSRPGSNYQQIAETCQEYIEANCVGKIYREFPRQFLGMDVSDLKAAARANEPGAKKAHKLLFDNRFKK